MTVQDVFDIAIRLMDEQNESTGATSTADTREYEVRTPSVLNSVLDRVYPYSQNYPGVDEDGKRPVCPKVDSLDSQLAVDDIIASSVLPLYLAYCFALTDASDATAYFRQMFETNLAVLAAASGADTVSSGVEDVYGGLEYGEFALWN